MSLRTSKDVLNYRVDRQKKKQQSKTERILPGKSISPSSKLVASKGKMIHKRKGLKRKEAEILIKKGSSLIGFSFCARKQQETQDLSSWQTHCCSESRA